MNNKINEEVFENEYKPQINHILRASTDKKVADEDICSYNGTMYETYGEEDVYIRKLATNESTRKRVWTVIDTDGELIIVAGWHFVNRMGYIITEKEWETGDEEVIES